MDAAPTSTATAVPDAPGRGVWDLLVIGAGAAGLVAARTAASLGASVLMVERDRPGGDCLWTGCVPSKALLAAASAAANARSADRLGVHVDGIRVVFSEVMAHVRAAITTIEPVDSADASRAAGVAFATGTARFTGPGCADVDGVAVRFRQALVATGSDPAVPAIPGLADALTSDTVWELTERPDRLVVLGGGAIGCELGQAFARLGSDVTIIEESGHLLHGEDPDAARLLTEALVHDGVDVLTGTPAIAVEGFDVLLADGRRIAADKVLVATGRRPDTAGLGLAAVAVATDDQGFVVVDAYLRTTNPRIWSAGDVTTHPPFTHVAEVHGSTAAYNAVLGLRRVAEVTAVPRVTYTCPEVAAVGRPAGSAGTTVRTLHHDEVDRAIAEDQTAGFTRLVLSPRGRVVGATVVGPRAGETLAELTMAVHLGLSINDIAGVMHPYPTWGDGTKHATGAEVRKRQSAWAPRRAIGVLAATRRQWLDRRT